MLNCELSPYEQLLLLRMFIGGGGKWTTVTGVSPLSLVNALAKPIKSLTQYGKCVQDGTPTPDAPVDIVCNNGVVGMVDDELPSGYTRLSYIESDGTSGSSGSNGYVDTGILINSIDTDVEIDFQLTDTYAPSPRMAWGYMGTPSSLPRWGFGAYSSKWLGSPNATASEGTVDTDRHVAVMRVYIGGSNSAFYNGTLDGETLYNANNLGNVSIFEGNDRWSVYLFARNNNNTAANFVPCKIFRFKVYKAGALAHDLVPCKDGNGALGFYDLVTATFSVASGTLIAGAADYSHSHIGADGTPEVLTVSASGATPQTASVVNLFSVGDYADEQDIISGGVTHRIGIKVFDGSEEWIDGTNGYITVAVQDQSGEAYAPVCTHFRGITSAPGKNSNTIRCYRTTSGDVGRMYFAPSMTTYPTKEDFAAWLAEQYAEGTPVIVLYPLKEETTEQTTAHSLHTSDGNNVVSVTSEVDPVELKAEYATSA